MLVTTKAGATTFTHNASFTGEVGIRRGDVLIKVSADSLRKLVAESIRHDALRKIESMKPADLLNAIRG